MQFNCDMDGETGMKMLFRKMGMIFPAAALLTLSLSACSGAEITGDFGSFKNPVQESVISDISLEEIPDFSGEPYVVLDGNIPSFTAGEESDEPFEYYSELDELGRCQSAYANICKELMPTEERGAIGAIKPTGWQTAKYEFVDGKYLYNRCHLIGYQLSAENANEKNLITGTRYMNVDGMLPFENEVADYVKETNGHVLYRVTPVFEGENLVASGVEMEAWSIEDEGDGVCFHVYVYNVQPGVVIDYATGDNRLAGEDDMTFDNARGAGAKDAESDGGTDTDWTEQPDEKTAEYILNTNTRKYHLPSCSSAEEMKPQNKAAFEGTKSELKEQGYSPCERCKP